MFKKILVPLSGSALSEHVLPLVKELLTEGAEGATLLTVCESPPGTSRGRAGLQRHRPLQKIGAAFCEGMNAQPAVTDGECEEMRLLNYLGRAGQPLVATGRPVCAAVQYGDPAEEIIDFAKAGRFDLILMVTHVRGPLRETIQDSIAAKVSRSGVVPVLALTPVSHWTDNVRLCRNGGTAASHHACQSRADGET